MAFKPCKILTIVTESILYWQTLWATIKTSRRLPKKKENQRLWFVFLYYWKSDCSLSLFPFFYSKWCQQLMHVRALEKKRMREEKVKSAVTMKSNGHRWLCSFHLNTKKKNNRLKVSFRLLTFFFFNVYWKLVEQ